jgi:transglutaminase superfamily protein
MRFLVWKALLGLLAFDVLGFGNNFAKMHRFVTRWKVSPRKAGDGVGRVCEAINYACVWYPKRVLCLQRSLVTTCLLRHCGVPAQMAMGARNLPFKAHAWTEVDGCAINERRDVQNIYEVLERC